jgi:hypothetical protein
MKNEKIIIQAQRDLSRVLQYVVERTGIETTDGIREAMRIIDLFALQVFAKNSDPCNFRLLQQNPARFGHAAMSELSPVSRAKRTICARYEYFRV